ncbi:Protein of unknown function [Lactobacillus delbrueckii subsp. lactis]|nr:Protein of unknown function [Lactobacillus delbrueckii subsp. lactis]
MYQNCTPLLKYRHDTTLVHIIWNIKGKVCVSDRYDSKYSDMNKNLQKIEEYLSVFFQHLKQIRLTILFNEHDRIDKQYDHPKAKAKVSD